MSDDKVLMPAELTAENGAKALMSGEFFEEKTIICPECAGEGSIDDQECPICESEGNTTTRVPVSWTTIKAIYKKAVVNLAEIPSK